MNNTINITQEQINFIIDWADLRREVYFLGANYVFKTGEECFPFENLDRNVMGFEEIEYDEGDEPKGYPWLPQDYYLVWIKEGADKWNSGMRKVPFLKDILIEDFYFDCPNCLELANGDRLELEGCNMCDYTGEILKYIDDGKVKIKHSWYDEENNCGTL